MANQIEYDYPIEEIDAILEKMQKGITPMISPDMRRNVELRRMELIQDDLTDEGEEIFEQKKEEMIRERIEKKRREAHKKDIIIIKLSEEQQKTLREEMETSIVRCNPLSPYNKSDEELFDDDEKRVIYHKLARIKNCYYNQADYVAAIKVIHDAIEYSLAHDYPWLTKQEAINAFNRGEIKFTYCKIPKLFINWTTQITDPQILKGVVSGEVTLQTKEEAMSEVKKKKRNKDYTPVEYDYTITGASEYEYFCNLEKMGYDTPIAPLLKMKNGRFNRYALPGNNRFAKHDDKDTVYNSFDWMRPGAGVEYYNLTHNVKYTSQDFIRDVNEMNAGQLNQSLGQNATAFLRDLKIAANGGNTTNQLPSYMQPLSATPESVELEKGILKALKMNNPML